MTEAAQRFVTPLAAGALVGERVFTDLFDLSARIRRWATSGCRARADLIIVAPATADLMAKAAQRPRQRSRLRHAARHRQAGADGAGDEPAHVGARRDAAQLRALQADGVRFVGPDEGEMAECGECGLGRMAEPEAIRDAALGAARATARSKGKRALVTAGPTLEAIDPVRFLSNRSSGKQGYAIAAALAELGADVTLVSGPTNLAAPRGVTR